MNEINEVRRLKASIQPEWINFANTLKFTDVEEENITGESLTHWHAHIWKHRWWRRRKHWPTPAKMKVHDLE